MNFSYKRMSALVTAAASLWLALSLQPTQAQTGNTVQFLNQSGSTTPFSEAVRVGNILFLSGQLGMLPGTPKVVDGGITAETQQAMANTKATLERYGYSLKDVVKCTVLLADMADFAAFNKVYLASFTQPYPARTLMAVKGLAFNARVEVECVAAKGN